MDQQHLAGLDARTVGEGEPAREIRAEEGSRLGGVQAGRCGEEEIEIDQCNVASPP